MSPWAASSCAGSAIDHVSKRTLRGETGKNGQAFVLPPSRASGVGQRAVAAHPATRIATQLVNTVRYGEVRTGASVRGFLDFPSQCGMLQDGSRWSLTNRGFESLPLRQLVACLCRESLPPKIVQTYPRLVVGVVPTIGRGERGGASFLPMSALLSPASAYAVPFARRDPKQPEGASLSTCSNSDSLSAS